jgi:fermentation-respiration switch protein FrsA (DUF1100 family)
MTAEQRTAMGIPPDAVDAFIEAQTRQVTSPWFRWFLAHDPAPILERVDVPVLALFGALDLQVPPAQNAEAVEAALRRGGNPDITVRVLPGLNHLFQTARTGAPAEYGGIDETMSPTVLELVSGWIIERFGRRE